MVSLFRCLHNVTHNCANPNDTDKNFLDFANKHSFYEDDNDKHLLIPVYSGIKPSMGSEFILNALISLEIFSTEWELLLNETLRGCFRNAKFICEEYDPNSLQSYLNYFMNFFQQSSCVVSKGSTYY